MTVEIKIFNFGDIVASYDNQIFLHVKRKAFFFDKVQAEYYYKEKLVLKSLSHQALPIKTKINFQNLHSEITNNYTFNPWRSYFKIGNNQVTIKDNPFYLLNKEFSKIYLNSNLVGKAKIKNRLGVASKGISNIEIFLDFSNILNSEIHLLTLCYLISCSTINSG